MPLSDKDDDGVYVGPHHPRSEKIYIGPNSYDLDEIMRRLDLFMSMEERLGKLEKAMGWYSSIRLNSFKCNKCENIFEYHSNVLYLEDVYEFPKMNGVYVMTV